MQTSYKKLRIFHIFKNVSFWHSCHYISGTPAGTDTIDDGISDGGVIPGAERVTTIAETSACDGWNQDYVDYWSESTNDGAYKNITCMGPAGPFFLFYEKNYS